MAKCSDCDKTDCTIKNERTIGCVDCTPSPAWFAYAEAAGIIPKENDNG